MSKDTSDWVGEFSVIRAAAQNARNSVAALEWWLWDNVVGSDVLPREMPEPVRRSLQQLHLNIEQIYQLSADADEHLRLVPIHKLIRGLPLTREQYYRLATMGILEGTAKALGIDDVDDYDAFQMLCYEDERLYTYINPDAPLRQQRDTRAGVRFGRPPEELRLGALRPEQHDFFAKYLPDILARFQRDGH
jgi:hypothetical protein